MSKELQPPTALPPIPALVDALALWIGYPLLCEGIECLSSVADSERRSLRSTLEYEHSQASEVLMREAQHAGLNPAPLAEESRICQELFRAIRDGGSRREGSFPPVLWFHHPGCVHESWPACLGPWRYALPPAIQEAIRSGEEVLTQLRMLLDTQALTRETEQTPTNEYRLGGTAAGELLTAEVCEEKFQLSNSTLAKLAADHPLRATRRKHGKAYIYKFEEIVKLYKQRSSKS